MPAAKKGGFKPPKRPSSSLLAKARSHAREVKAQNARERDEVDRNPYLKGRILRPEDIAGDYNASRALKTTLGGSSREITVDDLKAFERNIKTIGKRFQGGITAKEVIDFSLKADIQRAQKEITRAVPVWARKGQIHFVTNAGPNYGAERHHVDVQLLDHLKVVATEKITPNLARRDVEGRLAFTCDCGRHRFWYSFLATVGQFNAGRPETGYPKIRNPKLQGVACKHVLRVMKQLGTAPILAFVQRMIESDRKGGKAVQLSQAKARDLAAKQDKESGYQKNTIAASAARRAKAKLHRSVRQRLAVKRAKSTSKSAPMQARDKALESAAVKELTERGGLTAEQLALVASIFGK